MYKSNQAAVMMSSKSADLKETRMNWSLQNEGGAGRRGATKIYQKLFSLLMITSAERQ
jgi:hypothetical protein